MVHQCLKFVCVYVCGEQTLHKDPDNGFAKVHLGFILKAVDHKYAEAIPLLQEGIHTNASGVIDGRFFFHLGDALHRTGHAEEVRIGPRWGFCLRKGVAYPIQLLATKQFTKFVTWPHVFPYSDGFSTYICIKAWVNNMGTLTVNLTM